MLLLDIVFWAIMLYSLVGGYQYFGEHVSVFTFTSEMFVMAVRSCLIRTWKTTINISTAVRINHIFYSGLMLGLSLC
jgi:hypothetical protein